MPTIDEIISKLAADIVEDHVKHDPDKIKRDVKTLRELWDTQFVATASPEEINQSSVPVGDTIIAETIAVIGECLDSLMTNGAAQEASQLVGEIIGDLVSAAGTACEAMIKLGAVRNPVAARRLDAQNADHRQQRRKEAINALRGAQQREADSVLSSMPSERPN